MYQSYLNTIGHRAEVGMRVPQTLCNAISISKTGDILNNEIPYRLTCRFLFLRRFNLPEGLPVDKTTLKGSLLVDGRPERNS